VGQDPPWSVAVPKAIVEALGEDLDLYQKAKMSLSQSYGIGACAYLRRILENQVNTILDLLYESKRASGASENELLEIQTIRSSRVSAEKTAVAYKFAPASLVIEGNNPLKFIHDFMSEAIHELSEDECTGRARQVTAALEYVVRELRHEQELRKDFLESIRSLDKTSRSGA